MTFFAAWSQRLILVFACLAWAGCSWLDGSEQDELKDAHYLQGKRRLESMDYENAARSFEKALEANPRNSAARLELGLLYADKLSRNITSSEDRDRHYATAIHHLGLFLQLNPESPMAALVRGQIAACKLELVKTVPSTLLSTSLQGELERLNATNAVLLRREEQLKLYIAQQQHAYSNQFAALREQYLTAMNAARGGQTTLDVQGDIPDGNPVNVRAPDPSPSGPATPRQNPSGTPSRTFTDGTRLTEAVTPRTHTIRSGDTFYSLDREYRFPLGSFQAANPGVLPRKLTVGQKVRVPASND